MTQVSGAGPARFACDGKFFTKNGRRFELRGVTYGTFTAREDGALFPDSEQIKRDLSAISEAGFTVVRTYTVPPPDFVELAEEWQLALLPEVFYPDWRYLVGASRSEQRRVARAARDEIRASARRFTGNDSVVALSLGNEIPADVLRWFGPDRVAATIAEFADVVRDVDPERLVTYANYPTAEYLPLECLDFLTFNVYLEDRHDLRRYLTRLHHLAGDRPLVLGEVGLHVGDDEDGERRQAEALGWQIETAIERGVGGYFVFSWTDEWAVAGEPVEGWRFGLTREDRTPRPALEVATSWNTRTVTSIDFPWPSISVVICAYNAEATIDECLRHTCALDYPRLEIVVVDDGSTDATADIALRYPRVRLIEVPHGGLSVARNAGWAAATGELIAYLDSDAYPSPEWPYFLALGMDGPNVVGVGGPNIPPRDDPPGAHQVARAPGGPVHVLVADDRAEHVPGCNMAFWRHVVEEVAGFDPVYTSAGDDVDFCWRLLDRGWDIGFHPAALVWHHRRPSLRAYLRQQRGYGRSEALVEARHPARFTHVGTARWLGRIYSSAAPSLRGQRIYRGEYGTAAYQSVYQGGGHALDLAHQVGVPIATLLLLTAPLGLVSRSLFIPALLAVAFLVGIGVVDAVRTAPPPHLRGQHVRFRVSVAVMHLMQPLVRWIARSRHREPARRDLPRPRPLVGPVHRAGTNTLIFPADRPRDDLARAVVANLRHVGLRIAPPTGWEAHDGLIAGSFLIAGELVTTDFPLGCIQLRVRRVLHRVRAGVALAVVAVASLAAAEAGALVGAALIADLVWGYRRTGPLVVRSIEEAIT